MTERGTRIVLGLLAISFYATHGAYHLSRGFPENLLWVWSGVSGRCSAKRATIVDPDCPD